MDKSITIHPEFLSLAYQIENLKTELVELHERHEHMIHHEGPLLEDRFNRTVGIFEYEHFLLDFEFKRTVRKICLIRSCINRQEPVHLNQIEIQLAKEYEAFAARAKEYRDSLQQTLLHTEDQILTNNEAAEMKSLYRKLLFQLHPDFNTSQSEDSLNLFNMLILAYSRGDLVAINTIALLLEHAEKGISLGTIYDNPEDAVIKLNASINNLKRSIDELSHQFPFCEKENILDTGIQEEVIERTKGRIKNTKAKLEWAKQDLNALIKVLG